MGRANDWLMQAIEDLAWGEETFNSRRYAQVCFIAQQAAEKALKALSLHRGHILPKSHSVRSLALALKVNGEIEAAGRYLDRFYIASRYPDAYPEGYPSQYIEEKDASMALEHCRKVIASVKGEIPENAPHL